MEELKAARPDVTFSMVDDSVRYTHGNYHSAMATLVEGALLAVLVVLIFLRNLARHADRSRGLPLSAIPTFWAMDQLGFSLNLVSFLGITLATGILVDVMPSSRSRTSRGIYRAWANRPIAPRLSGGRDRFAVIAISLVIIAVFTPVSFMSGIAGQYFRQFGLTVAIAVFFSSNCGGSSRR